MAAYALLLLAALALAAWGFHASGSTASADARLVYCLQPGHRDNLVNAAVDLGLAQSGSVPARMRVDGRELTLDGWRRVDNPAFQRACDALMKASDPAPVASVSSGTQNVVLILLPVAAGALLTLAVADIREASDRRWAQADQLRADWREFESAVLSYTQHRQDASRSGIPPSTPVDENRRVLGTTLRKVHSQHRKSSTIRTLQNTLTDELGPGIADGWNGGDNPDAAAERKAQAKQIRDCLASSGSSLEQVACTLERRVWLSSRL